LLFYILSVISSSLYQPIYPSCPHQDAISKRFQVYPPFLSSLYILPSL
jgi:hypothetical protein